MLNWPRSSSVSPSAKNRSQGSPTQEPRPKSSVAADPRRNDRGQPAPRHVRREQRRRAHHIARFVEGKSLLAHIGTHAFEREQGRVAFVHVVSEWLDPESLEEPDSTTTQHDLLLESMLDVASVELVGDRAIFGAVLRRPRYRANIARRDRLSRATPKV